MPQIGPLEILAVAAIALIVFGPDKLPDIARSVGRMLSQLRRMADEVRDEFKEGLDFEVDEDVRKPPTPRSDHPNVRAEAAALPGASAGEEAAEDEWDPNYDIGAADDDAPAGPPSESADADVAPRREDGTPAGEPASDSVPPGPTEGEPKSAEAIPTETAPTETAPTRQPTTSEPDAGGSPRSTPDPEPDRRPEERAG
jgi:Tat protein translocase TatB subunit